MSKKVTHQDFLDKLYECNQYYRDGEFEVVGQYINAKTKIECKCLRDSTHATFYREPDSLVSNGSGCPKCSSKRVSEKQRMSHKEFIQSLSERNEHYRNSEFEVVGRYVNSDTRIECKCLNNSDHPNWFAIPYVLLKGAGCKKCMDIIGSQKKIITQEEFKKRVFESNENFRNGKYVIVGEYIGFEIPVKCYCEEHGYWETTRGGNLMQGVGCPKCGGSQQSTHEEFLNQLKSKNRHYACGDFEIISEYVNRTEKVKCKCNVCGYEWETTPSALFLNTNCPKCSNRLSTSYMEQFVYEGLSLALSNVEVTNRNRSIIKKELDIYIPDKKYAIELGSWHWHRNRVKDDLEKLELCKSKGIKLLIIYDDCDKEFENERILAYSYKLNEEPDNKTLKDIIKVALKEIDEEYVFTTEDWKKIETQATINCRKVTHKEFLEKLKLQNAHYNDIEILEEYSNAITPIKCRCKICGFEWYPTPYVLLRGSGCHKCGGWEHFSKEDFINELLLRNPHYTNKEFEIVGEYINTKTKIECRCLKNPNHPNWMANPDGLLSGSGCRRCGYESSNHKFSQEQFLEKLYFRNEHYRNGEFIVVGNYNGVNEGIECACNKHGNWITSPGSLFTGSGCPKCGSERMIKKRVKKKE